MLTIKVSDSGECRVSVRGPWDTVKKNLEAAANKVREMAHDSRKFASITEGTYAAPMRSPRQADAPQEFRPARTVSRPVPTQEELGAMGIGPRGGAA